MGKGAISMLKKIGSCLLLICAVSIRQDAVRAVRSSGIGKCLPPKKNKLEGTNGPDP
jgi:hypothetical protein